jgi:hypothetical protein
VDNVIERLKENTNTKDILVVRIASDGGKVSDKVKPYMSDEVADTERKQWIKNLQKKSEAIIEEMASLKMNRLQTQSKIGPVIYLAEALGKDIDTVVKYLILIFVLVFDPLAVSLVFCWNLAIRLREKYRGNELKISAHAITSPVDHRRDKKAA